MSFYPHVHKENAKITTEAQGAHGQRLMVRLLLACGAIGPLLYIIVFLVEGATRPGYSAWHNYVSQLSLGPQGWMQEANAMVCGALTLCFAIGLRLVLRPGKGSVWGPILLGLFGLGLLTTGTFTTDPKGGYSPGIQSGAATFHGITHIVAATILFISVAAACFVMARRFAGDPDWKWRWAIYSIITGIVVVVFDAASQSSASSLPGSPAGLLQRISIIAGWGWIALVAIRLSLISAKRSRA